MIEIWKSEQANEKIKWTTRPCLHLPRPSLARYRERVVCSTSPCRGKERRGTIGCRDSTGEEPSIGASANFSKSRSLGFVVPCLAHHQLSRPCSTLSHALNSNSHSDKKQGTAQPWCSRPRRGTAAAAPRRRPLPRRGRRPRRRLLEQQQQQQHRRTSMRPQRRRHRQQPTLPSTARRRATAATTTATRRPRPAGRGASHRSWPPSRPPQRRSTTS